MSVIFDLDNTLTLNSPRYEYLDRTKDELTIEAMQALKVNQPLLDLAMMMDCMEAPIIIITSRPERFRAVTMIWLIEQGLSVDNLLMRADDDARADHQVKFDLYLQHCNLEVWLVVEDKPSCVAMWKGLGLTCLQVV